MPAYYSLWRRDLRRHGRSCDCWRIVLIAFIRINLQALKAGLRRPSSSGWIVGGASEDNTQTVAKIDALLYSVKGCIVRAMSIACSDHYQA